MKHCLVIALLTLLPSISYADRLTNEPIKIIEPAKGLNTDMVELGKNCGLSLDCLNLILFPVTLVIIWQKEALIIYPVL